MRVLRKNGSEATAQNVHKVSRPAEARRAVASLPVIVMCVQGTIGTRPAPLPGLQTYIQ